MRFYLEFSSVTTNKYKPGLLDVGSFEIITCKCTVVDIKDSQKAYIWKYLYGLATHLYHYSRHFKVLIILNYFLLNRLQRTECKIRVRRTSKLGVNNSPGPTLSKEDRRSRRDVANHRQNSYRLSCMRTQTHQHWQICVRLEFVWYKLYTLRWLNSQSPSSHATSCDLRGKKLLSIYGKRATTAVLLA